MTICRTPTRRYRLPPGRAFTLIELVVAVALASLLMILVLSVSASVRRDRTLIPAHDQTHDWRDRFVALIQHDLIHGRTVDVDRKEKKIVIIGYSGLDRRSLEPTHRPTRVVYRLIEMELPATASAGPDDDAASLVSRSTALVREQVDLDDMTNRNAYVEVVQVGVGQIDLRRIDDNSYPSERSPLISTQRLAKQSPADFSIAAGVASGDQPDLDSLSDQSSLWLNVTWLDESIPPLRRLILVK